jgi:hypothetical protein
VYCSFRFPGGYPLRVPLVPIPMKPTSHAISGPWLSHFNVKHLSIHSVSVVHQFYVKGTSYKTNNRIVQDTASCIAVSESNTATNAVLCSIRAVTTTGSYFFFKTKMSHVFPHTVLTKVVGKPDNSSIKLLKKELMANAISIPSNRGGGQYGHLILTMNANEYIAIATHEFNVPMHPGDAPTHAQNATAPQITEENRRFLQHSKEYTTFLTAQSELKNQILAVVEPTFLAAIQHEDLGFAPVTVLQILEHLDATYGIITHDQLSENQLMLERSWNPEQPIEDLWNRIVETQSFAIRGLDPISDATVIRHTLAVFEKTGVFTDGVKDWRKLAAAEWNLPRFTSHFTQANLERVRSMTAQRGGFHGANAAATDDIDFTQAANSANGPNNGPSRVPVNPDQIFYYCWSHGLGKNAEHTSATCASKAPNHCIDAVLSDMKGGNNTIRRVSGERSVYHRPNRTNNSN